MKASTFISSWQDLLPSFTHYMQQDDYVQLLTPLLTRILYQWYERLTHSVFQEEILTLDQTQLKQLIIIDKKLMNYLSTTHTIVNHTYRMDLMNKINLSIDRQQVCNLWKDVCLEYQNSLYLSIFKVDSLIDSIQRQITRMTLSTECLHSLIQNHYSQLRDCCKDAMNLSHIDTFGRYEDLSAYLHYLLYFQECFVDHQLCIGRYDHLFIKQFNLLLEDTHKHCINISFSYKEITIQEKKELLEDLFEYRLTLLFQAHITDDYFKHLAHYDVIGFYYQYYTIVKQ